MSIHPAWRELPNIRLDRTGFAGRSPGAFARLRHGAETMTRETSQDSGGALIARIEGQQSPSRQGFDPYTLQEVMHKYRVPGVSVAVIRDFDIHWAKGFGTADVATGLPVDARTLFQAASISKAVTAMAVLNAVLVACAQLKPRRSLAVLRRTEKEYLSGPRWYDQAPADEAVTREDSPRTH